MTVFLQHIKMAQTLTGSKIAVFALNSQLIVPAEVSTLLCVLKYLYA